MFIHFYQYLRFMCNLYVVVGSIQGWYLYFQFSLTYFLGLNSLVIIEFLLLLIHQFLHVSLFLLRYPCLKFLFLLYFFRGLTSIRLLPPNLFLFIWMLPLIFSLSLLLDLHKLLKDYCWLLVFNVNHISFIDFECSIFLWISRKNSD